MRRKSYISFLFIYLIRQLKNAIEIFTVALNEKKKQKKN